jgi:cytoskeletal protein RodZ
MVESVGKRLNKARLERGLTIDEAAHATKLRPDKIAALESDDYSRFANNIYAKGFLNIYGRFLKVDVEDFARTLDNANPISIADYQYLSNAPATKSDPNPMRIEERRPPSLAPLFAFILLIGCALAGFWLYQNQGRIQGDPVVKKDATPVAVPSPTPNPDAAFISEAPPVAVPVPPKAITPRPAIVPPAATPRVAKVPATPGSTPAPSLALAAATPRPVGVPTANPSERDFVTPSPVAGAEMAARPAGGNVVLVATVKKTKVTIRRDDPKAAPIFEDFVYPNAPPLKLKGGGRFFIEAEDPSAVQMTKDGLPIAYQPAGVPVQ